MNTVICAIVGSCRTVLAPVPVRQSESDPSSNKSFESKSCLLQSQDAILRPGNENTILAHGLSPRLLQIQSRCCNLLFCRQLRKKNLLMKQHER